MLSRIEIARRTRERDQQAALREGMGAAARDLELDSRDPIRNEGRGSVEASEPVATHDRERGLKAIARTHRALRVERLEFDPEPLRWLRKQLRIALEEGERFRPGQLRTLTDPERSLQGRASGNALHQAREEFNLDPEFGRVTGRVPGGVEHPLVRAQHLSLVAVGRDDAVRLAEHLGRRPFDRAQLGVQDLPVEPRRNPRLARVPPVDVPAPVEVDQYPGAERLARAGFRYVREQPQFDLRVASINPLEDRLAVGPVRNRQRRQRRARCPEPPESDPDREPAAHPKDPALAHPGRVYLAHSRPPPGSEPTRRTRHES